MSEKIKKNPCPRRTRRSITRDWLQQSRTRTQLKTKERAKWACLHRICSTITTLAPRSGGRIQSHVIEVRFKKDDYLVTQFLSLKRLEMRAHRITKRIPHKIARFFTAALELLGCPLEGRKRAHTHNFPTENNSSWLQTRSCWTRVCVHTKCGEKKKKKLRAAVQRFQSCFWVVALYGCGLSPNVSGEFTASIFKVYG
jgi:hypothetical protein